LCIYHGEDTFLAKRNLVKPVKSKKAPGISSNRIPLIFMNRDRSKTKKNKHAQPRKTKRNSLKKKGPIFPW
jgi:hypothetical protein